MQEMFFSSQIETQRSTIAHFDELEFWASLTPEDLENLVTYSVATRTSYHVEFSDA